MPAARLMLCLTVLASSLGFAQTPEEHPRPSPEAPLSPPPLVPAPEQTPPAGESIPYEYRPSTEKGGSAKRLVLEALAGSGTGIVAGIAGALTGVLLVGNECADAECAIPILGSMTLGIVVGTPLGVYGVGRAMGGHGKYWASLGGTAIGSLAGLSLAFAFSALQLDALGALSLFVGPLAGAIVGYELSNSSEQARALPSESASSVSSGIRYVPVLGVTRAGSLLGGIAGQF